MLIIVEAGELVVSSMKTDSIHSDNLFSGNERLEVYDLDKSSFLRFRTQESQLHSLFDDQKELVLDGFYLKIDGKDGAMVSLASALNIQRNSRNIYVRIDLIVVRPEFRSIGLARYILLAALVRIVESLPRNLYSISCLAAHSSIEHLLESLNFQLEKRDSEDFTRCVLSIDERSIDTHSHRFKCELEKAQGVFNYKLRQREKNVRVLLG